MFTDIPRKMLKFNSCFVVGCNCRKNMTCLVFDDSVKYVCEIHKYSVDMLVKQYRKMYQ